MARNSRKKSGHINESKAEPLTEEELHMEIGATGLRRFSGFVHEEFQRELQGIKGVNVWREMQDNDPTVGAVLFAVQMLIRQVRWRSNPVSDQPIDRQSADFLESVRLDMSTTWEDTISEILSFLPFGWSFHEIVYKKRQGPKGEARSKFDDGRIAWRKLPIRAQDTLYEWIFDEAGGIQGMVQQPPPDFKFRRIPIEKALLFRTRVHKGNPEGHSVLRNAYRPWYFKKHIENIEGIGIERDLAGLPVAWVPPEILDRKGGGQKAAIRTQIEQIVKNIRRDEQEGLLFPLAYDKNGNKLYDFQLMSTGGRRQFDTGKIIGRYDKSIASTVLADFILLGHEGHGSFALSSSKTNLFTQAIRAWLEAIADVFNRIAIPRLFELNTFPIKQFPELQFGDIETVDLEELGNFISKITASGAAIFPDPEIENWLKEQAGMPVQTDKHDSAADVALPPTGGTKKSKKKTKES